MIWDILEQKIVDAGLGIPGQTLFRYSMPAGVNIGVMFKNPLTGVEVDPYLPGLYKPHLQAIVRHTKPGEGNRLADKIVDCLRIEAFEDYPESAERGRARLHIFHPKTLPIQFPRLDGNGFEWSLNFATAFSIQPRVG